MSGIRKVILGKIEEERDRQESLEKPSNLPWSVWHMLYGKYSGRVSEILTEIVFDDEDLKQDDLFKALVESVTIGVAWLEHIVKSVPLDVETITMDETDGEE